MAYTHDIPEYASVLTVEEFRAACGGGWFIDYDGYGCPAKDNKCDADMVICPSQADSIPDDATHIAWFNR